MVVAAVGGGVIDAPPVYHLPLGFIRIMGAYLALTKSSIWWIICSFSTRSSRNLASPNILIVFAQSDALVAHARENSAYTVLPLARKPLLTPADFMPLSHAADMQGINALSAVKWLTPSWV